MAASALRLWLLLLPLVLCAPAAAQPPQDAFPMAKGTYWIYRGTVAWQVTGEGAKVREVKLEWKTEVLDSIQRGRVKLALLRGDPRDLTWYEEGRKPGCYLLTVVDNQEFYFRPLDTECALPAGDLPAVTRRDELFLKTPARAGDTFAGDPRRDDAMYAWRVDERRSVRLSGIQGISPGAPRTQYVLTYLTNPDHQIATYVLGVGLTSYVYSHHGTTSEVNMKLVEFHSPAQ